VDQVEVKDTVITLTMVTGHNFPVVTLGTRPYAPDNLVQAITPTSEPASRKRRDSTFLSLRAIIPSFKLSSGKSVQLQNCLIEQCRQLLQTFDAQPIDFSFIDAVTSLLRLRVSDEDALAPDQVVKLTIADLKRFLIITWCSGILKCVRSADSDAAISFYSLLARNCAQTVSKIGPGLSIFCDDLNQALSHFPDGVDTSVRRIIREARESLDREAAKSPPHLAPALPVAYELALTVMAAVVVGMYSQDCEAMAARAVEYATEAIGERRDEPAMSARDAQARFIRDVTLFMDGRRYEENFHWVFCVWAAFMGAGDVQ